MVYNPEKHHRRSIRLQGYDYTRPRGYFITVCTCQRKNLFGEIIDGTMKLNEYGKIAEQYWLEIPQHFPKTELDEFVIMPNHIHGIIWIISVSVGTRHAVSQLKRTESFGKPVPGSVPTMIRSFKSAVTKKINEIYLKPGAPVWQRNYYERIIRNKNELNRIRGYIRNNPANWQSDDNS